MTTPSTPPAMDLLLQLFRFWIKATMSDFAMLQGHVCWMAVDRVTSVYSLRLSGVL
jgi:hypothetical protein